MLLDPLVSTIEHLQQRIQMYDASLRENETRTRMALIDPLLSALGWDTSDPGLVLPEYSSDSSSGRADYALLRPDGRPAAFIEAKKLGEPLIQHRMQMLNYSNASGVEFAGLTDGDYWELYEVFQRGQLEERRILDVSITGGPVHRCALEMLLLWRPNLGSGQPVAARDPVLAVTLPTVTTEPIPTPVPHIPVPAGPGWVSLSEFDPGRVSLPVVIRFSDGSEHSVKFWRQLVEYTVAWLWSSGPLTPDNIPVRSLNGRGFLIHNGEEARQPGSLFRYPRDVDGTPLMVDGHGSRTAMTKRTKTILVHCGLNFDHVQVQLGQ